MLKKDQSRKKYPSDLTDEQWTILEPLIPPAKQSPRGGHPRKVDMREVLNTIFYLNRSGCQWDMLPLEKRWVIERTNAWHGRYRRNSKDEERNVESSTAMLQISHINLMLHRLAPGDRPAFHYRQGAA